MCITPAALLLTMTKRSDGWKIDFLGRNHECGLIALKDVKRVAEVLLANELTVMAKELDNGIQSEGDSRLSGSEREALDKRGSNVP